MTPIRRHKYHAQPTVVDGIRFHSKREARRFCELRLLERAGEIRALELQPVFELYAACELPLQRERDPLRLGQYRGDFRYEERTPRGWRTVVEDSKGFRTRLYRWKKKHVEAQYGIEIREV